MKGTSKLVFYRSIWNENFLYKQEEGHLQLDKTALKNVTFSLSFQYGTAAKATRSISVIDYAERMANAGLFSARTIEELHSFKNAATTTTSYHLHQTA